MFVRINSLEDLARVSGLIKVTGQIVPKPEGRTHDPQLWLCVSVEEGHQLRIGDVLAVDVRLATEDEVHEL